MYEQNLGNAWTMMLFVKNGAAGRPQIYMRRPLLARGIKAADVGCSVSLYQLAVIAIQLSGISFQVLESLNTDRYAPPDTRLENCFHAKKRLVFNLVFKA